MNTSKWDERLVKASVVAMGILGIASATVGSAGILFGHQAVIHAGVIGLVVTTAIGVAAMVAVRIVGGWPRHSRRRRPVRGCRPRR